MPPLKTPEPFARLKRFLQDVVFEIAEEIKKEVEGKDLPRHEKACGIAVRYGEQLSLVSDLLIRINTRLKPLSASERDEFIAHVQRGRPVGLKGQRFLPYQEIGSHKVEELLEILNAQ